MVYWSVMGILLTHGGIMLECTCALAHEFITKIAYPIIMILYNIVLLTAEIQDIYLPFLYIYFT